MVSSKFDQVEEQEQNLTESFVLKEINKDLDFGRKTYTKMEESKSHLQDTTKRKNVRENTVKRVVSDTYDHLENTLAAHEMIKRRKATGDSGFMDRTGSMANADNSPYQSRVYRAQSKVETDERKQECKPGYNSMDIFLTGLNIIATNEKETAYCPILNLNISEIHFERHTTVRVSNAQTATSISCFYYNAHIGEWETFIESFKFYVNMDSFENKSCVTLKTDRTVNINLSDIAIGNLVQSKKEWEKLQEKKSKADDDLFKQIEQYQASNIVKFSLDQNEKDARATHVGMMQKLENKMQEEKDDQKAPVTIKNLTGYSMSYYKVMDQEEKESAFGVDIREPEKVYQPIRVEFEPLHYAIEKLDISKLHCGRHQLTDHVEDEVYFGIYLNKMYKVLTVRTFYTIHNKTIFTYYLRVFNPDGSYCEFTINPREKLPMEKSMEDNKVSISIADSENWSQMFYPKEILEQLEIDKEKSYVAHDMEYTFLSKEVDSDVNICYNLNLLPPVIVKNCLPCNINVKVPSRRDREFFILKGEESYFLSYDLVDVFEIDLKLDGFEYTTVKIDAKNPGSEVKIKMKDENGNNLSLFARIEKQRAGFEMVIYSKVCVHNYTGLDFELSTTYNGFKRRLAGQHSANKTFTLASKAKKLIVTHMGSSSPKLRTKNIGYKDDFVIKTRDEVTNIESVYDFVYETSLNLISNSETATDLFSKNIKIFPKLVIVNHLDTILKYKQEGNHNSMRILKPDDREILFWENSQFPQMIAIKSLEKREKADLYDNDTKWDWTKGIPVNNVGILSIQTRCNRDDYRYKILRVERRLIESTMYIIITSEDKEHPTYIIENCSRNVSLM